LGSLVKAIPSVWRIAERRVDGGQ